MMTGKPYDIGDRTKGFALRIIKLFGQLPKTVEAQVIGRQVLRSGTSVGAHVHEGKRSRSSAELVSKIEGGLQELEETVYWLELLIGAGIIAKDRLEGLLVEADELTAIMVTIAKNIKDSRVVRKIHHS